MRDTPKPSSLSRAAKAFGDATGVGAIARAALEGEQRIIEELVKQARKRGVSEADIERALAFKKVHDRAMILAAILFPWLPNPALLRLVAGKPMTDLEEPEAQETAKSLRSKAVQSKAARVLTRPPSNATAKAVMGKRAGVKRRAL